MNNADQLYPSPGAPKTTDEPRLFEVRSDEDLFRFSAALRACAESLPDGPRAYVMKELDGLPRYFKKIEGCLLVALTPGDKAIGCVGIRSAGEPGV